MQYPLRVIVAAPVTVLICSPAASAGNLSSPRTQGNVDDKATLSGYGAVEWNFESLLRETFKTRYVCDLNSRPGTTLNFPKHQHDCTPLSKYGVWIFEFEHLGESSFHVTQRTFTTKGWVANAAPVLIEGKIVACNKNGTRVLMGFSDVDFPAIECAANPYINHY